MALNFSENNDVIVPTVDGTTYRGQDGDDTYILVSQEGNAKVSITDTTGKNTIQLPEWSKIKSVVVAKNAIQITCDNMTVFTINGADKFNYDVGGNKTSNEIGSIKSYEEFVSLFDLDLPSSGTNTKSVSKIVFQDKLNQLYEVTVNQEDDGNKYYINRAFDRDPGSTVPTGNVDVQAFKTANHWAQSQNHINAGDQDGDNLLSREDPGHRWNRAGCSVDTSITGETEPVATPLIREGDSNTAQLEPTPFQATFNQPCFSCEAPNYYKIDDRSTTRVEDWGTAWNEETALADVSSRKSDGSLYQYGANAMCAGSGQNFQLEGCFENRCHNAASDGIRRIYDSERRNRDETSGSWTLKKPDHMEDTLKVSEYATSNVVSISLCGSFNKAISVSPILSTTIEFDITIFDLL